MRALSKSKILAHRQCPRRLWLEVNQPELRSGSAAAEERQVAGHQVGAVARRLYDPGGVGALIDSRGDGYEQAYAKSLESLLERRPIFEAGYAAQGGSFFADVMLPEPATDGGWRIIEVKSTGSVKEHHRDDAAVQAYVARQAGVPLTSLSIAHIDTSWVYPGGGDYLGLLKEVDVTEAAFAAGDEVVEWIREAHATLEAPEAPSVKRGRHCNNPHECGFVAYCKSLEPETSYPTDWLPNVSTKALKALIENDGVRDMREIPDDLLNATQKRVKAQTLEGTAYFDLNGAIEDLRPYEPPAYFLDFETIQFALPVWAGTRPFQQIPFQFSLHVMAADGGLEHAGFLELSGQEPSLDLAVALVAACGDAGPVFAYNAGFEKRVILDLASRFADLKPTLSALAERLVDLLPIARSRYYHPSQKGSWSIKSVLPAVAPDLRYDDLEGVKDGGMAMTAYLEAIAPETRPERREEVRRQLERYCELDTYAMVRLWRFLMGMSEPTDPAR